jgi:Right handed beta helix region
MIKITPSLFLAVLLGLCLHLSSAQAQYVHTCVSALQGNDGNTCHCTQPCRTFQRAHDQTLNEGQVTVLDAGGYGMVTITKSISIVNDQVGAATIAVSEGKTGITINASFVQRTALINLRGITIQGVGFGGSLGLVLTSAVALTMTNCVVRNHTGNGIHWQPSTGRGAGKLEVSNTLVSDNGGYGIYVRPTVNGAQVALNRVAVYNNSKDGIIVQGSSGTLDATVTDSVSANNAAGVTVLHDFEGATNVLVVRSALANNGVGLNASSANATLRVSQSTIAGNRFSWQNNGGNLRSFGDNNIDGNGDGDPAIPTVVAKK